MQTVARLKATQRYELKYLLHVNQALAVMADLQGYVAPDSFAADRSAYLVTSLYFDTADHKAYWDKIDGHEFRRKVRLRVYGDDPVTPKTPVFVEIKQRLNRALEKRRVQLPYSLAATLQGLERILDDVSESERSVLQEVSYLASALQLQPSCVVRYKRIAFNGAELDPGLRITFDTELKGRVHDLSLASLGHANDRYFVPPSHCIMEVKINRRLPLWLTEILAHNHCVLQRISKYCSALQAGGIISQRQRFLSG